MPSQPRAALHASRAAPGTLVDTLAALCLLLLVDVVLHCVGFDWLCRAVARWPLFRARCDAAEEDTLRTSCAAVHRARCYYFKYALCLQTAAAATCLLRAHGTRADLVIGVRRFPFCAHAWTEVDGRVVLDDGRQVSGLCTVIARY